MAIDPKTRAHLYVDYEVGAGLPRSIHFSFVSGTVAVAAASLFHDLLVARASQFWQTTTFTGARFSEVGSNVTNPVPFDAVAGTHGANQGAEDTPRYVSWSGRSLDGSKTRYYLYGHYSSYPPPGNYRFNPGDNAACDTLLDNLTTFIVDASVITLGGNVPILHNYTNTGISAYHQRRLRG